jgi:hypothetical protein
MAFVSGIFDIISGRVGDVVYRHKNGKTIVSRRPDKRCTPPSKLEIAQHTRFGISGQIAKSINSIEALKYFWKGVTAKNHAPYNKIFKANYGQLNIEDLTGNINLVPLGGFTLAEGSIKLNESDIVIQCTGLGRKSDFNPEAEKYVIAAGIIILKNPKIQELRLYESITFKTERQPLSPGKELSIPFLLSVPEAGLYENYLIKRAAAVFITLDEEGKPVQHSISILS